MKIRTFVLMATVLAATALFAACNGGNSDDNGGDTTGALDSSGIRTEKGLAVAAAGQALGANFGLESADGATIISATGGDSIGGSSVVVPPIAVPAPYGLPDKGLLGVDSAPYPFAPALQAGAAGLTVQGYGSATAAADEAVIEMWFYRDAYSFYEEQPFPTMLPDGSISYGPDGDIDFSPQTPTPVEPITEAELAPVIAALESFGASVEFVDENYGYRDPYYSNATLRATMTNLGSVDDAVAAAITTADGIADINNSGSNTYFSLSDCGALERAAMTAAVEDAGERADVLADVLGVGRGAVVGASSYSYSPYGDSSCSSSYYYGPYPTLGTEGAPGATDVQVFANIGITYAIQ